MAYSFKAYVDWDNNGNYTGTYDDISADIMAMDWTLGMRFPYQDVSDEAMATIRVDNTTAKYSPENTSSVLSGNILPSRPVQIRYTDGTTEYNLWTGQLDAVQIDWEPAGPSTGKVSAILSCRGVKMDLDALDVALGLYTNTTADVVIQDVADLINLPTNLETGKAVFADYGDAPSLRGWQVIEEMTINERGRSFIDRGGSLVFWNRQHLLAGDALNNDGTVSTDGTASDYKPTFLNYQYGGLLSTSVKIAANPRQTGGTATLWELDSTINIPAGEILTYETQLRESNGRYAATSALAVSNETYSSGTASITATAQGGKATLLLDNSGGAVSAVLTALTLSGAPQITQNKIYYKAEDASGTATYGQRNEVNINLTAVSSPDDVRNITEFELARRKTPRGDVFAIEFYNQMDGVKNLHQLEWMIGNRLRIDAPELTHNRDYFIIGEQHRATQTGIDHKTTFYLEPANANAFWALGVVGYSELGETTILGL